MKFISTTFLTIILTGIKVGFAIDIPAVCMSAPAVSLYPGLLVSARLDSQGKRCEAALTFSNPDFFPVRFDFAAMNCLGYQIAQFTVPEEVPNGNAFILWQCTDQISPTCTAATITGGLDNADLINFSQSGTISCVVPATTQTTLSTVVNPSTTFTETATYTLFSTSILSSPITSLASSTSSTMVSAQVQTLFSTSTSGSSTIVNTTLSPQIQTLLSTSTSGSSTIVNTTLSPQIQTLLSTSTGSSTIFNTILSTVYPTMLTAAAAVPSICSVTSLVTLTVTATMLH